MQVCEDVEEEVPVSDEEIIPEPPRITPPTPPKEDPPAKPVQKNVAQGSILSYFNKKK